MAWCLAYWFIALMDGEKEEEGERERLHCWGLNCRSPGHSWYDLERYCMNAFDRSTGCGSSRLRLSGRRGETQSLVRCVGTRAPLAAGTNFIDVHLLSSHTHLQLQPQFHPRQVQTYLSFCLLWLKEKKRKEQTDPICATIQEPWTGEKF